MFPFIFTFFGLLPIIWALVFGVLDFWLARNFYKRGWVKPESLSAYWIGHLLVPVAAIIMAAIAPSLIVAVRMPLAFQVLIACIQMLLATALVWLWWQDSRQYREFIRRDQLVSASDEDENK